MIDIPLSVTDAGVNAKGEPLDLITWPRQPSGAVGCYRLMVDGKFVSSSFDVNKTSWKTRRGDKYELFAFGGLYGYGSVPQPPPPSGKAPAFRTSYDSDPLGSKLDPLWAPDGKHVGGNATIDIALTSAGFSRHVQRHVVHEGDVLWGGERCEVMSRKIGGNTGVRFQVRFDLFLPIGFRSGSSWASLWDLHYPNDGPAQSPLTAYVRNDDELWVRVLGGPLNSDGTMGSVRHEAKLAILTQGAWHTLGFDIRQDYTAGLCDAWVDGNKVTSWGAIPTVSPGKPNSTYWKQGFYRNPKERFGTQTYFFGDTLVWFEGSPDAMLGWAA